jgi:hypothetical protein
MSFLLAACALAPAAEGKVLLTVDEALALALPGAAIERRTVYLTPPELERATALAGGEVPSAVVHPYIATRAGAHVGTAYFDTHKVRTLAETVMVAIGPGGQVSRVEVIAFDEPADYLARPAWYAQFRGRGLDRELALGRGIRGVTGATLTARAATAAVRRTLALDRVIAERAAR